MFSRLKQFELVRLKMWTFEQATGRLFDDSGTHVATGYSGGAGGKRSDAVNNPIMQSVKGVGPLPQGIYYLQDPVEHSHLGPYAIPLKPSNLNTMYGRDGFYCHGDNAKMDESASDGCIIMPRAVREEMYEATDQLSVVDHYSPIWMMDE